MGLATAGVKVRRVIRRPVAALLTEGRALADI